MTEHDDAQLDAALEALARPEPGLDHVASVLARTSRSGGDVGGADRARPDTAAIRPRWLLPVAATVVAAVGLAWQAGRQPEAWMTAAGRPDVPDAPPWSRGRDVEQPVLPPQAYWGMDAFEEWKSLRPGVGSRKSGVGSGESGVGSGESGVGSGESGVGSGESGVGNRRVGTGASPTEGAPQLAWVPLPSGLPPIELESIEAPPIRVAPLTPLEEIAVAEIQFEPIVIAPVNEQEKP